MKYINGIGLTDTQHVKAESLINHVRQNLIVLDLEDRNPVLRAVASELALQIVKVES